jgi:hypothetical protein
VRARLKGDGDKPGVYFFSTCEHLIRTLPALQHDADRPEDVDTDAEDHGPDAARYACMARPYIRALPVLPQPKYEAEAGRMNVSILDMIKRKQRAKAGL